MLVSRAGSAFSDGVLVDDGVRERLRQFLAEFVDFAAQR
jgi:hypothetical protein